MTLAYIKEVCISQVSFQISAAFLIWWNAEPDDISYVKRFLFKIEIESILLDLVINFVSKTQNLIEILRVSFKLYVTRLE